MRRSIFSNLSLYLKKNQDRGYEDISLFEIGPVFTGKNPGDQITVVCGVSTGKKSRLSWIETERDIDVFDIAGIKGMKAFFKKKRQKIIKNKPFL